MRLIFAGTPEFAQVALESLIAQGHDIVLVMTQPDRPAGRGLRLQPSPVKTSALAHGISVIQPTGLKIGGRYADEAALAQRTLQQLVLQHQVQAIVVAAYGLILPQWVLDLAPLGCINLHASLLPRWRGAAPIHRAVQAGDAETGMTIMQMDAGLDTGAILAQQILPIGPRATTGTVHDQLAQLGGTLCHTTLLHLQAGQISAQPQPTEGVTYAEKIQKSEAQLDWDQSALAIDRQIRAFNPAPGAATTWAGEPLKIWQAEPFTDAASTGVASKDLASLANPVPGTVLHQSAQNGLWVATGVGVLRLLEVQSAGSKRLPVAQWLTGHAVPAGSVLGQP